MGKGKYRTFSYIEEYHFFISLPFPLLFNISLQYLLPLVYIVFMIWYFSLFHFFHRPTVEFIWNCNFWNNHLVEFPLQSKSTILLWHQSPFFPIIRTQFAYTYWREFASYRPAKYQIKYASPDIANFTF